MSSVASDTLKQNLVLAIMMLERAEIIDFNGHVSTRAPETGHIFINSASSARNALTVQDIVAIDETGKPMDGGAAPPMELHIHTEIYKRRPDVHAVIHAHPRWSTYFSMTGVQIKPVFPQAALLGHMPLLDRIDSINTVELGSELAETLGPNRVALLKSHGSVIAAGTLEEAFALCIYLEENARRQYMAGPLGTPYILTGQEVESCARNLGKSHLYRKVWDYYQAKLR